MNLESREQSELAALLQEQSQYREEVRMFDTHLFRVILTYVTALVAAFGWLGTQIISQASLFLQKSATPLDSGALAHATTVVLSGLSQGPFFYLFAALPVISFLMFLYVARDWASLHERFALLALVSERIGSLLGESDTIRPNVFRFDRGLKAGPGRLRTIVEILLVGVWALAVAFASITILFRLHRYALGSSRTWWWRFGALGMCLTLVIAVIALAMFLRRSYGRSQRDRDDRSERPPNTPRPQTAPRGTAPPGAE